MTNGGLRSRAWPLLFAGIALLYLYFIPYFPALNNPNETSRVYQIRAAVELHKLSVNEQIARYGMVNDLGKRDGIYYAGKAPGTTFVGAPIYAALRWIDAARGLPPASAFRLLYSLRLVGALLPTLAFVLAFRRFLRRYVSDEPAADALATFLALGSMLLPYALLFVNHSLSAATAFGSVIAVEAAARSLDGERGPARWGSGRAWAWLALAGLLVAMSSALDYALLPVSLMLMVYGALKIRRRPAGLLAIGAGALVPSIATAVYHTICWGGPFKLSTSFLANPEFAANQSRGLFGVVGMSWASMTGILISPSKGLLYLAPVFTLGIAGAAAACKLSRERRLAVLCLAVTLWMIVYAGSLVNWDAGWTVGPRYMTVVVPFVVFSMGLCWKALSQRAKAVLLPIGIGLGIASVVMMTMTSVLFPHLPPEYKNPAFELIWPLWRDGITPHNLGRSLFGWSGRAAQAPFVIVLGAVLLYLVWVASGSFLHPRPSVGRRIASAAGAIAIAALFLGLASIPRTEAKSVVQTGTQWIRRSVWEPPIAAAQGTSSPRAR